VTIYPEQGPAIIPNDDDRILRNTAERKFARQLAKRFYDHKEPAAP
jgi:hypothetical protein